MTELLCMVCLTPMTQQVWETYFGSQDAVGGGFEYECWQCSCRGHHAVYVKAAVDVETVEASRGCEGAFVTTADMDRIISEVYGK